MTPFDVSNLNQAMAGVGNAFAERRREAMMQQNLDVEQDLREKMLDTEMRRLQTEQARSKTESEGKVDTWLQGGDGGTVHFQGPQSGLQDMLDRAKNMGQPLQQLKTPPTAKPQFGVYSADTPFGHLAIQLNGPDDLDKIPDLGRKLQAQGPTHASSYGPVAADQAAAPLEAQADQEEAQMNSGPGQWDPAQQAHINRLRQRVQFLRTPRYDPSQFATQTTRTDAMGQPVTTLQQKVPISQLGAGMPPSDSEMQQALNPAVPATAGAPPTAAPMVAGPVRVMSKAQRDALANGTRYVGPDGKTYIKSN